MAASSFSCDPRKAIGTLSRLHPLRHILVNGSYVTSLRCRQSSRRRQKIYFGTSAKTAFVHGMQLQLSTMLLLHQTSQKLERSIDSGHRHSARFADTNQRV